ncbi:MAG: DUF420 domain-containing protein [Burkholderiales bacterium]|nr:DUF420 domain-containing protein [Phycisphaerae bacterium]
MRIPVHGKELFAAFNSGLNATSALLLVTAYVFVRRRMYYAHGITMSAALLSSTVFLGSYLYSKFAYGEVTTGMPAGWFRTFYFIVLLPHVLLAIGMLPLIGMTVFFAATRRWASHRRIARPTLGIWLYVSVTGVLIYFILYQWYPALYPEAFRGSDLFRHAGTAVQSGVESGR